MIFWTLFTHDLTLYINRITQGKTLLFIPPVLAKAELLNTTDDTRSLVYIYIYFFRFSFARIIQIYIQVYSYKLFFQKHISFPYAHCHTDVFSSRFTVQNAVKIHFNQNRCWHRFNLSLTYTHIYIQVIITPLKNYKTDLKKYTPIFKMDRCFVIDTSRGGYSDGKEKFVLTDKIHFPPVCLTIAVFPLVFQITFKRFFTQTNHRRHRHPVCCRHCCMCL